MMLLEVDPNLVRPGWTPLVVTVLLGIVLFFLGRSMMKQFRRIDVPSDHETDPANQQRVHGGRRPHPTGESRTPPIPDLRAPTRDGGSAAPPDPR